VESTLAVYAVGSLPGPMPHVAPDSLALLTVTHNSAPELEAMLRSVDRHLPGSRVVVVDCASSDGTVALAQRWGCAVTVPLSRNVGFGRACNRGMLEVSEPVTALVNPDVEVLDGSLLALAAEALAPDRPTRLLAPLVLSSDGTRQDTAHPLPGSVAELLRAAIPPALAPGRLGLALAPWRSSAPRRVGWAVGCAVLARTETLRRLGPFDERIFLFSEDLDLGLHAAACGIQTWFWPQARIVHHQAHATRRAYGGEPFELLALARRDVISRRLGARRAQLDDVSQGLTFATRILAKRALGLAAGRERRQLQAVWRARQPLDPEQIAAAQRRG
jgi:N-acetylglucosaminyl-diphospho-decaprenol L-rhamnosyltransferase